MTQPFKTLVPSAITTLCFFHAMVRETPDRSHMIGLSRARPQIPGLERKCSWFRQLQKKISISFRYRLGLKHSGLAETALG